MSPTVISNRSQGISSLFRYRAPLTANGDLLAERHPLTDNRVGAFVLEIGRSALEDLRHVSSVAPDSVGKREWSMLDVNEV